MAFACVVKTHAFISALMSVAVLGSSLVVLISTIIATTRNTTGTGVSNNSSQNMNETMVLPPLKNSDAEQDNQAGSESFYSTIRNEKERNISESDLPSISSATPFVNNNTEVANDNGDSSLEESSDSTTGTSPTLAPWNAFLENQHDFWEAKSDTYIIIIQASSATGIFAALLQLGFSWLLICGTKDLKERTTLWNLSNFIVLILVVVIILVPLSYDSSSNSFKGSSVFWREIYRNIKSVDFSNTFETIWRSFSNFLVLDLALYYYILGLDAFILLALLIPPLVCCFCYPCKRCCCKGKRGKSESDLMLFGTGTGSV